MMLLSPLPLSHLDGQQVESGSIVRFAVQSDRRSRQGILARLDSDSLVLRQCFSCGPLAYSRSSIVGMDVFRGSTKVRNGLIGLVSGAVVGGLVVALSVNSQRCSGDLCGVRYLAVPYGVLIGGGLGLAIGIMTGKETWEPVL